MELKAFDVPFTIHTQVLSRYLFLAQLDHQLENSIKSRAMSSHQDCFEGEIIKLNQIETRLAITP